ncbi:hypothetical protein HCJ30_08655 [Listeria sp. FSL L7-1447]|nr:hypothetical protein [Listeria cossartiae subsp. cossartiae]
MSGANNFKFESNSKNHLKNVKAANTQKDMTGKVAEPASNGLKFREYLNEAGEIKNFFPILD